MSTTKEQKGDGMTSVIDTTTSTSEPDVSDETNTVIPAQRHDDTAPASKTTEHRDESLATPEDPLEDTSSAPSEKPGDGDVIKWVDPAELVIGANVRVENAKPDRDTVRDIKKRGVREPIRAYEDGSGNWVVVVGQLRTLAAIEAGCEQVPVWVIPAPPLNERQAEIERIIDQLNENDHRQAMTRGDEYAAHQQLTMLGLSAAAIARRRSRPKRLVENSLQVGDSELAAKAANRYELTLDQAAAVAEFETDQNLEAAKKLIQTAVEHPNNFAALAQRLRDERAEQQQFQSARTELVTVLETAGVPILEEPLTAWGEAPGRPLQRLRATPEAEPGSELTEAEHEACPGHVAWIEHDYDDEDNTIAVAVYGCSDFRSYGHAITHAPRGQAEHSPKAMLAPTADGRAAQAIEKERQRFERRWVRENNKDWDAATTIRRDWLTQFASRRSTPRGAQAWLAAQKATGHRALTSAMERGHQLARTLLGLGSRDELRERITNASPAKATVLDVFLTLAAMEAGMDRDAWRRPNAADTDYLKAITGWGYQASDVELKVLAPEDPATVVEQRLNQDNQLTTGQDAATEAEAQNEEDRDKEAQDEESGPDNEEPTQDPEDDSDELPATDDTVA